MANKVELYHPELDTTIRVPAGSAWVHERSGWRRTDSGGITSHGYGQLPDELAGETTSEASQDETPGEEHDDDAGDARPRNFLGRFLSRGGADEEERKEG